MLFDILHKTIRRRYLRLGFHSEFLQLEDTRVHYYAFDNPTSNRTIVLLHGLGTSSSTWVKILPYLQRDFKIVAIDLPGFGFSSLRNGKEFFTLEAHSTVLEKTMDLLSLRRFVLLGHSLGGWIAIRFASSHPSVVERLVLIDPAGTRFDGIEELVRVFDLTTVSDIRGLLNLMWHRYPWYFKPFARAILGDVRRRHVPDLVASIGEDDFIDSELSRLTMPVNIVWGKEDRLIPPCVVETFRERVRNVNVSLIERCGHIPQLESPSELKRILGEILQGYS